MQRCSWTHGTLSSPRTPLTWYRRLILTTLCSYKKLSTLASFQTYKSRSHWPTHRICLISANFTSVQVILRKSGRFSTPEVPTLGFCPKKERRQWLLAKKSIHLTLRNHLVSKNLLLIRSTGSKSASAVVKSEDTSSLTRYSWVALTTCKTSLLFPTGPSAWSWITPFSTESSMPLSAWHTLSSLRRVSLLSSMALCNRGS